MGHRIVRALLASSALALALPAFAYAANAGSLDSEQLFAHPFAGTETVNCPTAGGAGSESFNIPTGTTMQTSAGGPYPGTFSETGGMTFDASGGYAANVSFTIYDSSGHAVVTGAATGAGAGGCTVLNQYLANGTTLSYAATTPAGPDSGTAFFVSPGSGTTGASGPIALTFTSTKPPPRAVTTIATQASPSVGLGGSISDIATLAGGVSPTGTIMFKLFGANDATCTGTVTASSTKTVSGNSAYPSDPFTPATAATYRWVAAYSGDSNNAPASTACGDSNESVIVTPAPAPTASAVCQLARQFIQGSAKYLALPAPLRVFIDQQASAICQQLKASPLTASQKTLVTALVNRLVQPGWLTQTQATTLDRLIAQL